eukprot:2954305-Amphidinium_carterae.3
MGTIDEEDAATLAYRQSTSNHAGTQDSCNDEVRTKFKQWHCAGGVESSDLCTQSTQQSKGSDDFGTSGGLHSSGAEASGKLSSEVVFMPEMSEEMATQRWRIHADGVEHECVELEARSLEEMFEESSLAECQSLTKSFFEIAELPCVCVKNNVDAVESANKEEMTGRCRVVSDNLDCIVDVLNSEVNASQVMELNSEVNARKASQIELNSEVNASQNELNLEVNASQLELNLEVSASQIELNSEVNASQNEARSAVLGQDTRVLYLIERHGDITKKRWQLGENVGLVAQRRQSTDLLLARRNMCATALSIDQGKVIRRADHVCDAAIQAEHSVQGRCACRSLGEHGEKETRTRSQQRCSHCGHRVFSRARGSKANNKLGEGVP